MASFVFDETKPRKIQVRNVRLSYPHLFKKQIKTDDDGNVSEGAYSAMAILDKKEHAAAIKKIEDAVGLAAANAKWGADGEKIYNALRKQDKVFLRDGDDKFDKNGDPVPELAGKMFFNASSYAAKPSVFDRVKGPDGKAVKLTEEDGKPYAGCYVNIIIEGYGQDHKKHGRRINAGLTGVQFWADGEPLGGGVAASEDEFEYAEEEDADDLDFVA